MFENEQSGIFFNSAWRQFRKRGAYPTAITQNVEYLLDSVQASTMLSNSEFLVMLSQAASDREKLAKLLNISNEQMSYVTNADAGCGLIPLWQRPGAVHQPVFPVIQQALRFDDHQARRGCIWRRGGARMSNIRFASPEHRDFFLDMMGEARRNDCYHRAFFYVMGLPRKRGQTSARCLISSRTALTRMVCTAAGRPAAPSGCAALLSTSGTVIPTRITATPTPRRICFAASLPLLYGGRENPLPGILPGAAACEKAGGTGAIIRLNGGMNHGRIGSCPTGTSADY